jgi:CO/xanthine dehydrogenase Mo-binding subunit
MDECAEDLDLAEGRVRVKGRRDRSMEYERVVRAAHFREGGRTLVAEAFYDPPSEMLSKDLRGNVSAAYGFAAQAALVEVDLATGQTEVLKIASAHDVGRALNPPAAEGQIHGGIHMGLGYVLTEELVIREGRVMNPQFMEYALVPPSDMPEIAIHLIETVDQSGPFGAKGLGESGVIPVAAAVANAVKDAIGVRLTSLPLHPERVHRALEARASTSG